MFHSKHPVRLACSLLAVSGCTDSGNTQVPEPQWDRPSNGWDRPSNGWALTAPPPGLVGEGFEIGQVVPDVRLVDQNGDEVSLWQFWGDVVLVTVSAVWCNPCRDLAVEAEALHAELGPHGFSLLTVLEENGGGLDPDVDDAVAWAEAFTVSSPVLVDPRGELSPVLRGSYPAVLLLDRELVVAARASELSSETLHDLIESEL